MKTTNKSIKTWAGAVLSPLVTFLPRSLKSKFLSVLVLIAGLAAAPGASAQNTGGGIIYYLGPWAPGPTAATTTMNSDGSNKKLLVIGGYVGVFGNPSRALHDNHRWFVRSYNITGQFYPNGTQRREIFAMRDDSLNLVQLTDDPTLESDGRADWVPGGDRQISFKARRWSSAEPGATVVGGGLYTASLVFDGAGNITGLAAQPTTPAIPFSLVEAAPGDLWPSFLEYCWGPAGDQIAYNNLAVNELWVYDPLNGHTRIYIGNAQAPDWSLDGKIAFIHGGIVTIKSNGTSFKTIIRSTSTWLYDKPLWSPDGSFIVYTGWSNGSSDVFRATALGAKQTNLTSTPSGNENTWGGGWR